IAPPDSRKGPGEFEQKAAAKRRELRQFVDKQYKLLSEAARQRTPDYLVRAATMPPDPLETAIFFLSLAPDDLRPQIVARWRRCLRQKAQSADPVFGPWHDLMTLPESDFAVAARSVVQEWPLRPAGTRPGQLNPLVGEALSHATLRNKADVARAYGTLIRRVDEEARNSPAATEPGPESLAKQQIRTILADH